MSKAYVVFLHGMAGNKSEEFREIFEGKEQIESVPTVNHRGICGFFKECSEGWEVSFSVVRADAYFDRGKENLFRFLVLFTKRY